MLSEPLQQDLLAQYRIAHLNMLQGVIGRMANYSSSAKNFAVTIAAAGLALAFEKTSDLPLWIAIGATLILGGLDAYYLSKERGFRAAYERVAVEPLSQAGDLSIKPDRVIFIEAFASVSIWLFYAPMLLGLGWLLFKGIPL